VLQCVRIYIDTHGFAVLQCVHTYIDTDGFAVLQCVHTHIDTDGFAVLQCVHTYIDTHGCTHSDPSHCVVVFVPGVAIEGVEDESRGGEDEDGGSGVMMEVGGAGRQWVETIRARSARAGVLFVVALKVCSAAVGCRGL